MTEGLHAFRFPGGSRRKTGGRAMRCSKPRSSSAVSSSAWPSSAGRCLLAARSRPTTHSPSVATRAAGQRGAGRERLCHADRADHAPRWHGRSDDPDQPRRSDPVPAGARVYLRPGKPAPNCPTARRARWSTATRQASRPVTRRASASCAVPDWQVPAVLRQGLADHLRSVAVWPGRARHRQPSVRC